MVSFICTDVCAHPSPPLPLPFPSLAADLHLLLQPADQEVVQTHPEAVVVLSCIAEGVPPPTVSLYRKMQQISMVEGVGAMETAVNNTLVIGSPTVDDADLYTCIAQNAFGVVESRPVQVKVTGECGGQRAPVGQSRQAPLCSAFAVQARAVGGAHRSLPAG